MGLINSVDEISAEENLKSEIDKNPGIAFSNHNKNDLEFIMRHLRKLSPQLVYCELCVEINKGSNRYLKLSNKKIKITNLNLTRSFDKLYQDYKYGRVIIYIGDAYLSFDVKMNK